MSAADKIGLLWGFGWLAGHGFLGTLLCCWLITPIGHWLVGVVLENRWVPMGVRNQFPSFSIGDWFLGLSAALFLVRAQHLPSAGVPWYTMWYWHVLVLITTLVGAFFITRGEAHEGRFPARAIWSPTKIYHNFVLYGLFGYVMVVMVVANVVGDFSWSLVGPTLPLLVWLGIVLWEQRAHRRNPQLFARRALGAHSATWQPFWAGWRTASMY